MQILSELWTGEDSGEVRNSYQYVLELKNRLEDTCKLARESLYEAQGQQRHYYDKNAKDRQFIAGQKVLVLLPTDHNKLTLQWKGPYEVTEKVNRMDYKVNADGKIKIFHANLLKEYHERDKDTGVKERHMASSVVIDENLRLENISEICNDVGVCENLSQKQQQQIRKLLQEFIDILTNRLGETVIANHAVVDNGRNK